MHLCNNNWDPVSHQAHRHPGGSTVIALTRDGPSPAKDLAHRLSREAFELINEEPLLGPLLRRQITERDGLGDMLAGILADVLATADLGRLEMASLFLSIYTESADLLDVAACDVDAVLRRDPASDTGLTVLLNQKGFQAISAYRLASVLWRRERRALARYLQGQVSRTLGVDIHPACRLGKGAMFDHATGIVIGETSVIGDGVSLLQGVTLGGTGKEKGDRHPKVGNSVLIGAGATLLGNITIGDEARIGAGSVVLMDVPPHATAVGVPARVISRTGVPTKVASPAEAMDHNVLAARPC